VRQAVQRAVDVDAVLEAAYFGVAERANGIVAPGLIGHREKLLGDPVPNVEEARALLAEAGHPDGFSCTLDILNKTERLSAAQVIQANLAEIGIEVQINQHDSGTFWVLGSEADGDQWKNVQLILQRFSMQPDPSFATAWFTPEQIGVWNWERFRSPEFGELHQQTMITTDAAERDRMYKRMQDLMEESGAYVFLTHETNGVIYRDTIVPALLPDANVVLPEFQPGVRRFPRLSRRTLMRRPGSVSLRRWGHGAVVPGKGRCCECVHRPICRCSIRRIARASQGATSCAASSLG
jgi:peptide/nickel transport system substrate-binding protein